MSTSRTGASAVATIQSIAIESRVIPASGPVISRSSPSIRLISVDLPAFGRPTIASLSGAPASPRRPRRPPRPSSSRSRCGSSASNRSAMPSPCSARQRDRIAEARARSASSDAGLARAALGLVGDEDDRRRPARSQRAISSSSGVSPARASIMNSATSALAHRRLGLRAHPAGQALRVLVLEAGGVDHAEIEAEQLASPSRRSRVTPGRSSTSASACRRAG